MESDKNSREKDTSAILELVLNFTIMMSSFLIGSDAEETINLLIDALKAKKKSKADILCGGMKFNGVLSTLFLEKNSLPMLTLLKKLNEKTEKESEELWKITAGPILESTNIGKRPPSRSTRDLSSSDPRVSCSQTKSIEPANVVATKPSIDHSDMIRIFENHFEGCKRADFEILVANVEEAALEIVDYEKVKLVKLFSVSVALHDRLNGSKKNTAADYMPDDKIIDHINRITGDYVHGVRGTITEDDFDLFTRLLPDARRTEGKPAPPSRQ